mmetsp:Transcript_95044/g.264082  ORF Transcript_95044/g.264082 Transcript_95044/m.264082 type:complete len:153 (+) Transcript_95044:136-594(+)
MSAIARLTVGAICGTSAVMEALKGNVEHELARRLCATARSRGALAHPDLRLTEDIAAVGSQAAYCTFASVLEPNPLVEQDPWTAVASGVGRSAHLEANAAVACTREEELAMQLAKTSKQHGAMGSRLCAAEGRLAALAGVRVQPGAQRSLAS